VFPSSIVTGVPSPTTCQQGGWSTYWQRAEGEERLPVSSIRSYLHAAEQNLNKTSHVPLFAPCRHATHSTG